MHANRTASHKAEMVKLMQKLSIKDKEKGVLPLFEFTQCSPMA